MIEKLIEILNNIEGNSTREKAEYLINEGIVVVPKVEKVYEIVRLFNCVMECNVATMRLDELKRFYDEKHNFYTSLEVAENELARVKQSTANRESFVGLLCEALNELRNTDGSQI